MCVKQNKASCMINYACWLRRIFVSLSDRPSGPSAPTGLWSSWTGSGYQVESIWRSLYRLMLRGLHGKDFRLLDYHHYMVHVLKKKKPFWMQVKIWDIPVRGLQENLTKARKTLIGHSRRVGLIEWHPTAANLLLSAAYDHKVRRCTKHWHSNCISSRPKFGTKI